ncbi:GNAT family N-acetyltransferase [Chloroflexi bacterium TSY]|nr:GNAT family N-acetyltransferase [Chloroflexi bacterium TSY]
MSNIQITNLQPEHAAPLRDLQLICFPTTAPDELFHPVDLLDYAKTFPKGNFVALDGDRVVGLGAGGYYEVDFDHLDESMRAPMKAPISQWHDPEASWYYGTDISVHPDYRGHGIGSKLYAARKAVVQHDQKRGIIAGGFLPGFAKHKMSMTLLSGKGLSDKGQTERGGKKNPP